MSEPQRAETSDRNNSSDNPSASRKPSANFSDLRPRVVSAIVLVAAALATLYAGGEVFTIFWLLASYVVFWEWQGLVGGGRRRANLVIGAVALATAAAFSGVGTAWIAIACIAVATVVLAALAEPRKRLWVGGGVVYAGILTISACLLRESAENRRFGHCMAVRHRLGGRHFRLFRRPGDRRPKIMASRFRRQNLVRNIGRRF